LRARDATLIGGIIRLAPKPLVATGCERVVIYVEPDNGKSQEVTANTARVREWFEQQLIETVMSAHALAGGRRWSEQEVAELWTESALTAAVLPRYHINMNIKRMLGQRLGKLRDAA
jgi:hypothetical protein